MMKRTGVILLLLLNILLVCAVIYLVRAVRTVREPERIVEVLTNEAPPVVLTHTNTVTVTITNDFRWAQIESEDYRTYITRLRSIGCPEETIRDLIIADVDKLLAPRLQALAPTKKDLKYWESKEKELADYRDYRERLRKQREIDFEKRDVVRDLIGIDLVGERLKTQGQEDFYGERLTFLPDAKRTDVRKILEKYDDEEIAIREKIWEEGESLQTEDKVRLRQLSQARQAEVAKLLSPTELRDYELWLSDTAHHVRDALAGMESSEPEFLALYDVRKKFDQVWPKDDLIEESERAAYEQAKQELNAEIRSFLGEAKYAEYERGQDPEYRELQTAAARYKVPPQSAAEVYEFRRSVQGARENIRLSETMTASQKETALTSIATEAEKAVKETLGQKAFSYYQKTGKAAWIRDSP